MDGLRSPIAGVITVAALVFLYVPLGVVVLFSFHSTGGLSFPFEGVSLRWYRDVFGDQGFRDALVNSTVVAVATSVVTLVLGTMAAYGLSRTASRLRAPLAALLFVPVTLPGLFIGIALLSYFSRLQIDLSLKTVDAQRAQLLQLRNAGPVVLIVCSHARSMGQGQFEEAVR